MVDKIECTKCGVILTETTANWADDDKPYCDEHFDELDVAFENMVDSYLEDTGDDIYGD